MKKATLILALAFINSSLFAMSLDELNSASKTELIKVVGIGNKKAESIIKERKKGAFKSFEDLQKRVKGVGKSVAQSIKDYKISNNDTNSSKKEKDSTPVSKETSKQTKQKK